MKKNLIYSLFACFVIQIVPIELLNAQSEEILKSALEGKRVEVLIDMPATEEGIDLYVDIPNPMNFGEYSDRIKSKGVSIRTGDIVMITKIKKKRSHIEIQLAGGGYGTFFDESAAVMTDNITKTSREKELEKILDDKNYNGSNKKTLEKELKDLRRDREIEQSKLNRDASMQEEIKRSRIDAKRQQGGSRFNIRYDYKITESELTVESVMNALREYVHFRELESPSSGDNARSEYNLKGQMTFLSESSALRKGMTLEQMVELFGMPSSLVKRDECGLSITQCEFDDKNRMIQVILVEDILVKYSTSSK